MSNSFQSSDRHSRPTPSSLDNAIVRQRLSSDLLHPPLGRIVAIGILALALTLTLTAVAATQDGSAPASRAVWVKSTPRDFITFVTVKYVKVRGAYEERGTIWTADPDGSNRRRLARGNYPDISPDGRRVAFLDWAGRLRVVPSRGGPARLIARGAKAGGGFVWAPSSRQMAITIAGSLLSSTSEPGDA